MSSNPWINHVQSYIAKHPGVAYKDALKLAKKTYKKRGQKGRGEMEDMSELDFDFDSMDLGDSSGSMSGYQDYSMPPVAMPTNLRKENRDTRFMTRKMLNQLIKLKKKNDKNALGYSMDQLKQMAIKGINI